MIWRRKLLQSPHIIRSLITLCIFLFLTLFLVWNEALTAKSVASAPSVSQVMGLQNGAERLCRFGVNVTGNVTSFDTATLRMGWYVDYGAKSAPPAIGADYAPIIRLSQIGTISRTGVISYTYTPSGSQLQAAVAGNPGAVWFIGNEPDRPGISQDDMEPAAYASAYHELYYLIKGQDPAARIFAGNIVQATPIRLQYLDLVLANYQTLFGERMPVDGWSIHGFILNEVSCDYDNTNCWGAEVPSGVNANFGEILTVEDNDSITLFIERIQRFRQWMYDRGYNKVPLYLSEYGILMPDWLGFDSARVNAFMNATFDYLRFATDAKLGDPADGYNMVQQWSWYSTSDINFNGWLFDPITTTQMTAMGTNYAGYTSPLSDTIDFQPAQIFTDPQTPFSSGENVTVTLKALVGNSGNLVGQTGPVTVRFYDGDPLTGGTQIGPDRVVTLSGCGDSSIIEVTWPAVSPGRHQVYVVVDADETVLETDELNNVASKAILIATERVFLPIIFR